ncbi:MAG: hypothetical protein JWM41_3419 [Gemmatimonadetes bacterium]|nr:hypothetical protein [Gemmatimonadota bacterium]
MSFASLWPWAIAAAIVGVVICVVIAVLVLRASRAKMPMVPASAVPAAGVPGDAPTGNVHASGMTAALGLRKSFSDAHRAFRAQTHGAADRLAIPWVLSVGEVGCGKTTMLNALTLPRLPGVPREGDSSVEPACNWSFFEQGVVLDIAGALLVDPTRTHADDRAWNALVTQLQKYRPERPLDAVVLSIPVTDLVGTSRLTRDALGAKAGRIGDRLAELQNALSLRLPVYVVVTKCDSVPGFGAFCRSMPAKRLDDMLGWSSPYSVDAAFVPAWADEAMDSVLRGVQEAEFAALAREDVPTEGGSLFLFPLHLGRVRSPLREYLHRIFRPTTYERGSFFRGVFFTGDRNARAVAGELSTALASAAPVAPRLTAFLGEAFGSTAEFASLPPIAPAESSTERPAFINDLFGEKIFSERGLAQPGARVFPSKNKIVARMQIAAAAIVLLGPLALYAAMNGVRIGAWRPSRGIRAETADIKPLLQNIDVAVRQMETRRKVFRAAINDGAQEVSVFQLLDNMASLSTNHLWSVFLPGTLVSPLHRDITDAIGLSFQTIILPEFRDRLQYRTRRLVDPENTRPVRGDERFGANLSLPQYLSEVNALGTNIAKFNSLAERDKGSLEDIAAIVHYLYGEEVAPGFLDDADYYRAALATAHSRPIAIDTVVDVHALRRAGDLTRSSYVALLRRLSGTQIGADSAAQVSESRADVEALAGLRAFLDTAGPVERTLSAIRPPFMFGDDFAPKVRDTLTFYTTQLTGQVLPRYTDAAHSSDAVLHALDALLRQPFMQAPATRTLVAEQSAGTEISWDVARLDEVIALHASFDAFMAHGLDALPDVLRNRVRRLATVQVGAAMTDGIASAEHLRASPMLLADRDRDLTAKITAFDQSATRIAQLLEKLDAMGATTTYDALLDLTSANATALLARVDAQLDLGNRYRLPPSAVGAWNGHAPFSTTGFGGRPGALDDFLAGEQEAFRSSAQLARPMVGFLRTHADDASRRSVSLRNWDVILAAVDRLDKKPASGPIAALEATIRYELDSIDTRTCARRAARPAAANDLFAQRADAMWSAVWRRCADISSRDLMVAYGRLQSAFRTKLAGRFPFSTPDAQPEATAADIADFLRSYDAFVAVARQSGPSDDPFGLLGSRVDAFVTEMARVRTFFQPYLDSAAVGRLPTYDYQIDFRVNRSHETGANQIAEWTADVGDQHAMAGAPVASRRGRWRAGDDIRAQMRWATGSQVVPTDPAPAGSAAGDAVVTFSTSGQWSLLRLLRQYESDIPDPDGGQTLKFTVRTARRGTSADASSAARAYLRLRLYNPDTKAELTLPHFPGAAPDLGADDRR